MKHFLAFLLLAVPVTLPKQLLFRADGASVGNDRGIGAKLGDIISVKDPQGSSPGAVGDGVTNDTAAIQAAWNAVASNNGRLYFPCGTYLLSSISITPTFFHGEIDGAGMNCVTLKANSASTVIAFTDTGANSRFTIKNLTIDGNSLAASGLVSTQLRFLLMERVIVKGTTTVAVDVEQGWDNDFISCEFSNNTGDGLLIGASGNNVNIERSKIVINSGWGIKINTGNGPINIRGNDISANSKGGIQLASHSTGSINNGMLNVRDNYFEGNAAYYVSATTTSGQPTITTTTAAVAVASANVGHAYYGPSIPASTTISSASGTTITLNNNATASTSETEYIAVGDTLSATNVFTDILLNGSGDFTTLSTSYPFQVVNVTGNISTAYAALHFVLYETGRSISVTGNARSPFSVKALILWGPLSASPPGSLTLRDNDGFSAWNGQAVETHGLKLIVYSGGAGGSVAIDLSAGSEHVVTPSNANNFTISNPVLTLSSGGTNIPQSFTIRVRNTGTLGVITWDTLYKMSAWTNPANGFSRAVTFTRDSAANAWVQISQTGADIPN